MKKYLSAIFSPTILALPLFFTSMVSHALVLSNDPSVGVLDDPITKKSKRDWSCWETDPTPNLSIFEGSYCGIFEIAPDPDAGEDGYIGLVRAYNTGLSTMGRNIAVRNTFPFKIRHVYGAQLTYDKSAFGKYQLEALWDDTWEYVSIADQKKEVCDAKICTLEIYSFNAYHSGSGEYSGDIYVRAVAFGSKRKSSGLILKNLKVLTYFPSGR